MVILHTGGETGETGRLETLTVMVRRRSYDDAPALIDVPISIAPLDNSPPQLVIGSHLVVEVDSPTSLGPEVISASDRDTSPHRLTFFVVQTPVWGQLERQSAPMNRRGLDKLLLNSLKSFRTYESLCTRFFTTRIVTFHIEKTAGDRDAIKTSCRCKTDTISPAVLHFRFVRQDPWDDRHQNTRCSVQDRPPFSSFGRNASRTDR